MINKISSIITFTLLCTASLWADYSPDVKWKEVYSRHFHIIYDEVLEEDVLELIQKMENISSLISGDLGGEVEPFTIVLPSGKLESNGYVSSFGNRSVFYPLPPEIPFSGNIDWYELLAIHEARHMIQYTKIRDSFLHRLLYLLMGDYGLFPTYYTYPGYFFEGDAVLTETLLSEGGRGRSPGFEMYWRTALLSGEEYSFAKTLHGSDKRYTPNEYVLGYYLMTYLKRSAGDEKYEEIVNSTANNPFPLSFSSSTFFSGEGTMPKIFDSVKEELLELWSEQDKKVTPTKGEMVKFSEKDYEHYLFPQYDHGGALVYLYYDYDGNRYLIREKGDKIEKFKDVDSPFTLSGSSVIYTKLSSHPRWVHRQYSDIYLYDLDTREEVKLTEEGRYFGVTLSSDGSLAAAVDFTPERVSVVTVLDVQTGRVIWKKTFPESEFIRELEFGENNSTLYFVDYRDNRSAIASYSYTLDQTEYLTEFDAVEKMDLEFSNNQLYYVSSQSGIYDVFQYSISDKTNKRVVSSRFGSRYPYINGGELVFNNYTENGFSIERISLNNTVPQLTFEVENLHVDYFTGLDRSLGAPEKEYELFISDYKPNNNLFNFHSWILSPNGMQIESESEYSYDFRLISTDDMERMYVELIYLLSYSGNNYMVGSIGEYSGLYPEILWNVGYFSNDGFPAYYDNLALNIPLSYDNSTLSLFIGEEHSYNMWSYNTNTLALYTGIQTTYESGEFYLDNSVSISFELLSHKDRILTNELSLDWEFFHLDSSVNYSLQNYSFLEPSSLWEEVDGSYSTLIESSVELGGTLLQPEFSIINWFYLKNLELFGGYTSLITDRGDYSHYLTGRAEAQYYLFRLNVGMRSACEYYYNPDSGEYFPVFTPIEFYYN